MANPILGQILQSALRSGAGGGLGGLGGLGGGLGGLGGILGGMLGGGGAASQQAPQQQGGSKRTVLLAMMLPLVMRWVQNNGGIGAVLDRFRSQGMGRQADSWVSTGENHDVSPQEVRNVVGDGELSKLASSLGVPEDEVAHSFAQVLPELADKLTPEGRVTPASDQMLSHGANQLEQALGELHADMQNLR